jgi:D-arabinose 5-phosphate isomerase GutQ
MTKQADNAFYAGAFSWLSTNSIRMTACSAAPANYAGIAAVALATATVAGGDFTVGAGDVSGRKVTVAAKSGVTIDSSGTATHVVLHDNDAILGYVTECDSLVLTSGGGNTVSFPAWDIEIAAPA